ncbi:4Fe-4S dicluster domain-containing protein [Nocardioides sp. zg-DK7169]|uniref:4Fe-4S dicluster domain-containing protein n=1 Tax=Nocardioides sp. zg-DK7169 TaxID=2736600 RepID=UPI00155573E5|nr:4Fe-4S dicluster domain-containing protein [Nocardioides sp. zg-DK7169]NPC97780.1 4Fe-4S dicluster domain-containing protein [Nocardioides sp. zg-DK7169]
MTSLFNEFDLWGPLDPAADAGYGEDKPKRKGFFTDTSICIGCKACEVACKEWNDVPADHFDMTATSYDNSHSLNSNQWRHVAFIEQPRQRQPTVDLGMPTRRPAEDDILGGMLADGAEEAAQDGVPDFRWLMSSDVCKHCTHAACLDVCPTGSLFRSEFGTVVVQDDICNGCGYCVPACPYGVIERRRGPEGAKNVGIAQKCTLCYDRLGAGQQPACSQACPTQSIQFGDVEELRERAEQRVARLHEAGVMDARLYGNDPHDGVGGTGAFFLLLDEPEVYGFPPDPVVTTRDLPRMFRRAGAAAGALLAGAALAFVGRSR